MPSAQRSLIVAFVLLLLLPAVAVAWLGSRLLQQDEQLEARQWEERRTSAADRIVASLTQSLSISQQAFTAERPPSDDAVVVIRADRACIAYPTGRVLFYPDVPPQSYSKAYDQAEELEFRQHDGTAAMEAYRTLAASSRGDVRAGALMRLARALRGLDRNTEARRVYQDLAQLTNARVDGVPAPLAARRAEIALLDSMKRGPEAQSLRDAVRRDLSAGTWRIDRGTFEAYAQDLQPSQVQLALADAVDWLSHNRNILGREVRSFDGLNMVILWQGSTALIAGPRFQTREWFEPLAPLHAGLQLTLAGFPSAPQPSATRRLAAETGLPWTVVVSSAAAAPDPGFSARRKLLLGGLALLVSLVATGGYFTLRAISRELAVSRLQSDFVSAVSHEFRTPLTSLRQFNNLLLDDPSLPQTKRDHFYQAQARATERLHRLVESLLDFGRMEAGAHPYQLRELAAAPLVQRVAEEFAREAELRGFSLETSIPESSHVIRADPEALSRALWNLLENAMKYSGESRTIWLDSKSNAETIGIRVRDRGFGIPQSEQSSLFRKFVRGEQARAAGIKGTGIGLAMVHHIVTAHSGKITVESVPGQGSAFTIFLPHLKEHRT